MKTIITVKDAAQALGVSTARIKQMLDEGKLKGDKIGPLWIVNARSLKREQERRQQAA